MPKNKCRSVLIVDPDAGSRGRLRCDLEARGWTVWATPDGPTAVRTCQERREEIQVALVDLQLPGLQGARTLAQLGQLKPTMATGAMSAQVSRDAAAAFRQLTSTRLFSKPVRADELDTALREMTHEILPRRESTCGS